MTVRRAGAGGLTLALLLGVGVFFPVVASGPGANSAAFVCDFQGGWANCGFSEQAKGRGRISAVVTAGVPAIRLQTLPGDAGIYGSGRAERADLSLSAAVTGCSDGVEQWWAHSVLFPDDYVIPVATSVDKWPWGVVFNFHHTGHRGQANFQVEVSPEPVLMRFSISAGEQGADGAPASVTYRRAIGPIERNLWYQFVYHVKWSSGTDGYFDAWVNGEQKLAYRGPTLYSGQGCYLKLANYHTPLGRPVSVLHARVRKGPSREAVTGPQAQ